jgi:replication factor A1
MDNNEEKEFYKLNNLNTYSRGVNTIVKVIRQNEVREVTTRNDSSQHRVTEVLVADETGSIYLTLWDESIDEIQPEMVIQINNAYVNVFRGSMRLNIGRYGTYELLEDAPFEEVNEENNLSSNLVEDPRRRGYSRSRRY